MDAVVFFLLFFYRFAALVSIYSSRTVCVGNKLQGVFMLMKEHVFQCDSLFNSFQMTLLVSRINSLLILAFSWDLLTERKKKPTKTKCSFSGNFHSFLSAQLSSWQIISVGNIMKTRQLNLFLIGGNYNMNGHQSRLTLVFTLWELINCQWKWSLGLCTKFPWRLFVLLQYVVICCGQYKCHTVLWGVIVCVWDHWGLCILVKLWAQGWLLLRVPFNFLFNLMKIDDNEIHRFPVPIKHYRQMKAPAYVHSYFFFK